ncbi:type IV secretion system protein [Mesorhizobium sp. WSM2239]|uniref:Type IV secretion system protein n=2 Tax=unclassified Mesorhizobium TaxID=325217 RepID=A0AAU8DIF9_9HYPH
MNPVSTIISDLLNGVDQAGARFVEVLYKRVGLYSENLFFAMLVLYVVVWGYMQIFGRSTASPLEAAWRLGRAIAIYWFVTNWAPFSETIYTLVQSIPEILANRIVQTISSTTGTQVSSVDAVPAMFDGLYEATLRVVPLIYTGSLTDFFGALLAIIIIIFTLLFIGVAVAAIIAAKVLLFIILALGPVWIIMALFNYSFKFTEGFFTVTANLVVQQLLIYGFLGFYYYMVQLSVTAMDGGGGTDITGKLAHVMPLLLVTLVGFYVLLQVPIIAGILTGSGPIGTAGAIGSMWRSARGAADNVVTRTTTRAGGSFLRGSAEGRQRFASDMRAINIQRETARNASSL